ncbi:MAG: hypothetical protein ABIP81_05850 [Terriglobales bacterium]
MRTLVTLLLFTLPLAAAELNLPASIKAGADLKFRADVSSGSTFYLTGPGTAVKRDVKPGEEVSIGGEHLRHAGNYMAVIKDGSTVTSKSFFVEPGEVSEISFLARPSRVPVSTPEAIRGVAFVFDAYQNLVVTPTPVKFDLAVEGSGKFSQSVESRDGVAWIKTASGRNQGAAQFVASAGTASVRRVVQQTAADPCNLRMRAQQKDREIIVETDPIRDCNGNPVPDGTIVTFTQSGSQGRSTVDARVKRGTAKASLPVVPGALLSVASGVVLGNEIRWGGGQ